MNLPRSLHQFEVSGCNTYTSTRSPYGLLLKDRPHIQSPQVHRHPLVSFVSNPTVNAWTFSKKSGVLFNHKTFGRQVKKVVGNSSAKLREPTFGMYQDRLCNIVR
jgi:hypothetical protein